MTEVGDISVGSRSFDLTPLNPRHYHNYTVAGDKVWSPWAGKRPRFFISARDADLLMDHMHARAIYISVSRHVGYALFRRNSVRARFRSAGGDDAAALLLPNQRRVVIERNLRARVSAGPHFIIVIQ